MYMQDSLCYDYRALLIRRQPEARRPQLFSNNAALPVWQRLNNNDFGRNPYQLTKSPHATLGLDTVFERSVVRHHKSYCDRFTSIFRSTTGMPPEKPKFDYENLIIPTHLSSLKVGDRHFKKSVPL
ncbi:hypothetical protein J6590_006162 [Homalodisca vitripennis]|nr:hypothetical protein J6590_006162 [Homalodisca vitripennis]